MSQKTTPWKDGWRMWLFWPVKGWTDEDLAKLKSGELE